VSELLDLSIFSKLTTWIEKMGEFVLEIDVVLEDISFGKFEEKK